MIPGTRNAMVKHTGSNAARQQVLENGQCLPRL
jgi:hypothetical protein